MRPLGEREDVLGDNHFIAHFDDTLECVTRDLGRKFLDRLRRLDDKSVSGDPPERHAHPSADTHLLSHFIRQKVTEDPVQWTRHCDGYDFGHQRTNRK